ncbi:YciI family protein [Saccharopolyspora sp. 5N708]|uniref:YciI family protein n=1 Tax=Saccharopolyspora sp. 5N708 TaxID=3457424 RepID=UPI003FD4C332
MKFLLNVYAAAQPDAVLDHADFVAAVRESGELVDGQQVADPSTSAVVRVRDGMAMVADGPYLESPVQLAAYYLVDCEDRERALELAATVPAARCDAVEVRPVMLAAGMEM